MIQRISGELRNSRRTSGISKESMSYPFIRWVDSSGKSSNSTTPWTTQSPLALKRWNARWRRFGLPVSRPADSGFLGCHCPKNRNGSGSYPIDLAGNHRCVLPWHYVQGRVERSVDPSHPSMPLLSGEGGQFKIKRLPKGVENEVGKQVLPLQFNAECNTVRFMAPVWLVEFDPVPACKSFFEQLR